MKLCISHFSQPAGWQYGRGARPRMPFVEKPRNYPPANLSGSCVIQVWSLFLPPPPARPPAWFSTSFPTFALLLSSSLELFEFTRVRVSRGDPLPATDVLIGQQPAGSPWGACDRAAGRSKDDAFARHLLINDVSRGRERFEDNGCGRLRDVDVAGRVTLKVWEWWWWWWWLFLGFSFFFFLVSDVDTIICFQILVYYCREFKIV